MYCKCTNEYKSKQEGAFAGGEWRSTRIRLRGKDVDGHRLLKLVLEGCGFFWPAEASYGLLWLAVACYGLLWLATAGYKWLWLAKAGYGCLWLAVASYSQLRLAASCYSWPDMAAAGQDVAKAWSNDGCCSQT